MEVKLHTLDDTAIFFSVISHGETIAVAYCCTDDRLGAAVSANDWDQFTICLWETTNGKRHYFEGQFKDIDPVICARRFVDRNLYDIEIDTGAKSKASHVIDLEDFDAVDAGGGFDVPISAEDEFLNSLLA